MLLPIYGVMVPFHVTTIKGVSHTPVRPYACARALAPLNTHGGSPIVCLCVVCWCVCVYACL